MTAPQPSPRIGLADALLESDARYFELAAETDDLGGAQLALIPGLADVPADEPREVDDDYDTRLEQPGPEISSDGKRRAFFR